MKAALPTHEIRCPDAPRVGEAPAASPREALRQCEQSLTHAMSLAQLVDWEYDVASGCFTFSDRYYTLHGTTAELEGGEVMSAEVFVRKFLHPDDAHQVADEVAKAVATADPDYLTQVEARIFRRDGELRHVLVHIAIAKDAAGRTIQLRGANQDITERKRTAEALKHAEEKLAESERLQKAILDNIPDPAWLIDRQGRFLVVNRAWCEYTGLESTQAVGKTTAEVFPAEVAKRLWEEDERVMSSGRPLQHEEQLTGGNRNAAWFETFKTRLVDEQGTVCGVAGIARDINERKLGEAALLESQRFLQSTLNALSAHIAILDEQGEIIAVNAAWDQFARQNRFLGSNYGMGANYLRLCEAAVGECAEEAPAVAQGIRTVMTGQCGEFLLEYPCHSPQEQRWFTVRVTRFAGEGPVRVVVAHENITARKRAEEELQWKTAFLEAQVNSSLDGILVVDAQDRKTLQNQRMTDLLKIPQSVADDPDDENQRRWVAQSVRSPEAFLEKIRYLNAHPTEVNRDELELKDGTVLDRYTGPLIGRDGAYYGRIWTFRDITERKRTEAVLAEQLTLRERLAKIAANVPGIIYAFRLRPDGSISMPYVSPTIEEFAGMRAEDLLEDAALFFSRIHADDHAHVSESIAASARSMLPWRSEFRVRHPTKGLFWADAQSTPELEADGCVLWHGFMSDITERRQATHQLLLAKEAADSANLAKSQFLAMMSHEIRTPMNGLIGFTQLLLDTPLSEEQNQFVQTIRLSGQTLLKLINDILDFSKIEAGKLTMEAIRFELPRVVREVAELLAVQARQKQLTLDVHCDPAVSAPFMGDPGRVRQILLNLAGNAIKFTRRGGITIRVRLDGARAGFVRCEITDTGIGIPVDKQALLFQQFSQADSSTARRYGGTGLGLAISRRLVELMGGQIGLSSEPTKGSTFWFTLPATHRQREDSPSGEPPALPTTAAEPDAAPHPPAGCRVLLAEDNAFNQKLAVLLLEKLLCHVEIAANGLEAVALAASRCHDVIFMDCLMPEMDGLEAAREIRRAEKGAARVPIIAVTASVLDGQREKCLAAGMDDFIAKPIQGQDLEQALRKWVLRAGLGTPRQLEP